MSVQYTGGCAVHREAFSTLGISLSTLGDIIEYTGGCSLHGGYHEYIGECHDECRGYHEYSGGV